MKLRSNITPFESAFGKHLFVVDGSRIFDVDDNTYNIFRDSAQKENVDDSRMNEILADLDIQQYNYINADSHFVPKYLNSVSLNVAQSCNMSCSYCYADEGKFGGQRSFMKEEIAFKTIDSLFLESDEKQPILLGFMGGEPLLARETVHASTKYAWDKAKKENREIHFSITTNGTLIQEKDAQLFQSFPFNVTISIDGDKEKHNLHRKMLNGSDSYEQTLKGLKTIINFGKPKQLSARVTVSPKTGRLLPLLEHLISLGFDDVGFSAVLVSPDKSYQFNPSDFIDFTKHMIECGEKTLSEIKNGNNFPFSNLETAIQEIHKGTHRPYPCGAGASYMSVNSKGEYYACHRFIDDSEYIMGDIFNGSNLNLREDLLIKSHVDKMEPCNTCWARYLCGGGCYHEVKQRGRIACDYIRNWLMFCLSSYIELSELKKNTSNETK